MPAGIDAPPQDTSAADASGSDGTASPKGKLFPSFVARLSGLPFDYVTELRSDKLDKLLEELAKLSTSIDGSRMGVADALHASVGQAADKRIRNAILEMRRSLFNERVPSDALLARALDGMSADSRAVAEPFVHLLKERVRVRTDIASEHGAALAAARRTFRRLLADERFLKGLLLSSPTLYQNVARYRAHDSDRLDSRLEQIERGLLRYFTRAATKATPFGTFCTVVAGRMQPAADGSSDLVQVTGNIAEQRGVVRLNRRLLSILWTHLKTRPAVRRALMVTLNTTLQRDGGRWVYLAKVDGREVFQRLGQSEALELVLDVVRRNPEATLGDLIDALAQEPELDTTSDEATAYLDALIERGLLTFRPPVDEQEPDWPESLRLLLAPILDEHAALIAGMLSHLRDLATQLESSRAEARVPLDQEMRRTLEQVRATIGTSIDSLNGLLYYEDATANAAISLNHHTETAEVLGLLVRLVETTQSLSHPRTLQATMRHFFDARFADRPSVPLLDFYECFYREHFKEHQEKEARLLRGESDDSLRGFDAQNPFQLASVSAIHATGAAITSLFRTAWQGAPSAHEVNVPEEALMAALGSGPRPTGAFSSAFFCHGLTRDPRDGKLRLIMPSAHYSCGFGKYFSRFLHLLPTHFTDQIRFANRDLSRDLLAEIGSDGEFNADMHPPLLADLIAYPTAEVATTATVTALDLCVVPDATDPDRLTIVHQPTGRTLLPIDLGFRNPKMRPPLFQLLSHFAPSGSFAALLPETLAAPSPESRPTSDGAVSSEAGDIISRPRFTYGERIVLARRRWTVSRHVFPQRLPGEAAATYFIRVNEWRHRYSIPDEVYVRVDIRRRGPRPTHQVKSQAADLAENGDDTTVADNDDEDTVEAPMQDTAGVPTPVSEEGPEKAVDTPPRTARHIRYSRDWRKPQYIDFRSPLVVTLFGRLTGSLRDYCVQIEERCPTGPDLPRSEGSQYAGEYVIQISS